MSALPLKLLAFDFDGVLADSHAAGLRAMEQFARLRRVPSPGPEALRQMTLRELMRHFRVRWWMIPHHTAVARRLIRAEAHHMTVQAHIVPTLRWAIERGIRLAVVSTNATDVITSFVQAHLPWARFDPVVGDAPMFGKHRPLRRLRRRARLDESEMVYVGDEVRDVVAARRAGIDCAAVSWGKDRAEVLEAARPWRLTASGAALQEALAGRAGVAHPPAS